MNKQKTYQSDSNKGYFPYTFPINESYFKAGNNIAESEKSYSHKA